MLSSVVRDAEFENLVKPLSEVELHRLRVEVCSVRYARIRIWNNIVLCDVEIYKLWRVHHMPCEAIQMNFSSRNEALMYVCDEELKRDDLTHEYRKYLIGKKYLTEIKGNTLLKTNKLNVAHDVGKLYSVKGGAVQKYGLYSEAIDRIFCFAHDLALMLLDGTFKVSHEKTIEISHLSIEEMLHIAKLVRDSRGRMSYPEIRHELGWNAFGTHEKHVQRPKKSEDVEIKKMPAFDPDADITGIALTIPSWINALNRAVNSTMFERTTLKGREKLKEQLYALFDAVLEASEKLEVR